MIRREKHKSVRERGVREKPCDSTIIGCRVFNEYFSAELLCLGSKKTYSMPGDCTEKKSFAADSTADCRIAWNRFDVYGIGQSGLKSIWPAKLIHCKKGSHFPVPPVGPGLIYFFSHGHTVHKLIDCLHPMECIPETQFIMRSIHLAVLLHLRCKCEREKDYSQFEQILLYACFIEEPGSNPAGGKNLRQSWNISKATPLGRDLSAFGTTICYSTTVPHWPVVFVCSRNDYWIYF